MPCRILAVDDSTLARRAFVAKPLRAFGYDVVEAMNGQDALEAYSSYSPDIIITDLLMPVLDGFDLVELLRDAGVNCPIIVASADIQDSSRERIDELDTFGFLNKPFRVEELIAMVRQAELTLVAG